MSKKAVDTLEKCTIVPHEKDMVDRVWEKIHNSELSPFVNTLKVHNQLHPRSFRKMLQNIAS